MQTQTQDLDRAWLRMLAEIGSQDPALEEALRQSAPAFTPHALVVQVTDRAVAMTLQDAEAHLAAAVNRWFGRPAVIMQDVVFEI